MPAFDSNAGMAAAAAWDESLSCPAVLRSQSGAQSLPCPSRIAR